MGLDIKDQKKLCGEITRHYYMANKKDRGKLLDEYTMTRGYNRDYLTPILSNWGRKLYVRTEDETVAIITAPALKQGQKARNTAATFKIRTSKKIRQTNCGMLHGLNILYPVHGLVSFYYEL